MWICPIYPTYNQGYNITIYNLLTKCDHPPVRHEVPLSHEVPLNKSRGANGTVSPHGALFADPTSMPSSNYEGPKWLGIGHLINLDKFTKLTVS